MTQRRRFGGVDPNRREQPAEPVDINVPGIPSQPPSNNRRPIRPSVIILGLLMLVIVCGAGIWGLRTVIEAQKAEPTAVATNAPWNPPTTNNSQPTAVGQGGSPVVNTAVPGAPRERLSVCIVNFGPYFPVLAIPDDNPVYDLEVIPLNFYVTPEELAAGQFINPAGEAEQIAMLANGTCDVLFTTIDVLSKHPDMGELIAVVGQSDGADKTMAWNLGRSPQCNGKPINIFNDLQGCVFAVADDSVGYFQALSFLKLANITSQQVTINTYDTPDEAVAACLAGQADVCSGWVPTIDEMVIEGQTKTLVDSRFLKTIYDGIFVSPNADQNKGPAVLAFVEDWFEAVKLMQDNLPEASARIAAWTYNGQPTNEYTFVYPGSETDDMVLWLETYAQAGFNSHFVFQANPDVLYEILKTGRETWEWSGQQLDAGFDPATMVDLTYFQALGGRNDLTSANAFVNNSFSPFPAQSGQPATREQLINLPTLVEVNCPNVYFRPGQITLDPQERAALVECGLKLKPLMNQSNIQFLIVGSAAWPDAETFGQRYAQCGTFTDADYCAGVAKDRAAYVLSVFTGDPLLLLPGNRFAIDYRLGEKTSDQQVLQENRFGAIEAKVGGLE